MESSSPKPCLREPFMALTRTHHYRIRTGKSHGYWIRCASANGIFDVRQQGRTLSTWHDATLFNPILYRQA